MEHHPADMSAGKHSFIIPHLYRLMTDQIDYTKIMASEAYLDKENGRCRLNHLLCEGGDCRTCNFITDSSLMLVLENIMHELKHMQGECGCEDDGCGCDCCHE